MDYIESDGRNMISVIVSVCGDALTLVPAPPPAESLVWGLRVKCENHWWSSREM